MLDFLNPLREINMLTIVLRLVFAVLIGTVIGLERSARNRPAGFRTHILVCLGAAVAALTSIYLLLELKLPADVSRICAAVISGLGFIGAGTIIVTRNMSIKGLTTAAGLWTTGIIGLAIGAGFYELGFIGAALVLVAETVFGVIGNRIKHAPEYSLEICYEDKLCLDNVLRYCKDNRMTIVRIKIHTLNEGKKHTRYAAEVRLRGAIHPEKMADTISQMKGIASAVNL